MASTSRKSRLVASGTVRFCQLVPPSVVRSTVPFAPLAHATVPFTALTPRRRAVTPLCWSSHFRRGTSVWLAAAKAAHMTATVNVFTGGFYPVLGFWGSGVLGFMVRGLVMLAG